MTIFQTPEDVLAHFGVKGMRWGVRRNREDTSSNTSTLPQTQTTTSAPSGTQVDPVAKNHKALKIAALGGGAIVAGVLLKKYGGMNVISATRQLSTRSQVAITAFKERVKTKGQNLKSSAKEKAGELAGEQLLNAVQKQREKKQAQKEAEDRKNNPPDFDDAFVERFEQVIGSLEMPVGVIESIRERRKTSGSIR